MLEYEVGKKSPKTTNAMNIGFFLIAAVGIVILVVGSIIQGLEPEMIKAAIITVVITAILVVVSYKFLFKPWKGPFKISVDKNTFKYQTAFGEEGELNWNDVNFLSIEGAGDLANVERVASFLHPGKTSWEGAMLSLRAARPTLVHDLAFIRIGTLTSKRLLIPIPRDKVPDFAKYVPEKLTSDKSEAPGKLVEHGDKQLRKVLIISFGALALLIPILAAGLSNLSVFEDGLFWISILFLVLESIAMPVLALLAYKGIFKGQTITSGMSLEGIPARLVGVLYLGTLLFNILLFAGTIYIIIDII